MQFSDSITEKSWKTIFIVLSIAIAAIMAGLSHSYGFSGDEWVQIKYGQDIWNYFAKGNTQALNYDNLGQHYTDLQYYGGIFDFITEALHHLLPGIAYIYLRHFINACLGALMMIYTGSLAKRISGKWHVAILSLLFIFLSPRLFGESMNNPKDIPFAAGFIVCIYYIVALLQQLPQVSIKYASGIALGLGLAFGQRSAGGFLLMLFLIAFSTFYLQKHKAVLSQLREGSKRPLRRFLLLLAVAIVAGYIIGILAWPWALQSPVSNPIASLQELSNRNMHFPVLFEGVYRMNNHMPWYYELKWIFITSPIVVLAGTILFILFAKRAMQAYGLFYLVLLAGCAFFPLAYIILKHATVYDTWRHVFFVYPFWVIMAALSYDILCSMIKTAKWKQVPVYIALFLLTPPLVWIVRSHPNQYIYFNELEGGIKGAYGNYDLDYYQNSCREACEWIKKNAPHHKGKKIIVLSNVLGIERYFDDDTSRIKVDTGVYEQRHYLQYDYFISTPRYVPVAQLQNQLWPPRSTVYGASMEDIPLCVVLAKTSGAGITAHNAFLKGDYLTAVTKYEDYLKADSLDEGAYVNYALSLLNVDSIDRAVIALKKATEFNPQNPSYYDGLKSMYELKGDLPAMQKAGQEASSIRADQEELNEE